MKICSKYSTFFTLSLSIATLAGAEEANDWTLLAANYSTTAFKYVTKDYGSLNVKIQTSCASTYADAEKELEDAAAEVTRSLEKYSTVKVNNPKPDFKIASAPRYEIIGGVDAKVIDKCSKQAVTQPLGEIDLTATTFDGGGEILIETKEKLSTLTELRQKLNLYAADLNKANDKTKITVPQEVFGISAEAQAKAQVDLDQQSELLGNEQNRLNVDREFSGGFAQSYVVGDPQSHFFGRQQGGTYTSIRPKVDASGKSVLTAYYTFDVRYLPKDFSGSNVAPSTNLIGNRQFTAKGTVVTDTDYYLGQITLTSTCHPSEKSANDAILAAAASFRDEAHAITETEKDPLTEQVRIDPMDPYEVIKWTKWHVVKDETPAPQPTVSRNEDDSQKEWIYLSLCDGKTQATRDENSLPKSFEATYTITVFTKNFEGLKRFSALATKFNEGKSGATRVQASSASISPRLHARKHFEAIEVIGYKSALENLVAPQGELAKFLTGDSGASEAYYSFSFYGPRPASAQGGRSAFESAPKAPAGAALEAAQDEASPLDGYSTLDTEDGDIPQGELSQNLSYAVRYRPKKDLVQILKDRSQGAKPQGGVELR